MSERPDELYLTEEDLVTYVGRNSEAYLAYFRKCQDANKLKMGFIWTAFLVPWLWLAYRRLYLMIAVLVAVVAAAAYFFPSASGGGFAGLSAVIAMQGRGLVVRRAWQVTEKARDKGLVGEERQKFIARKGGVSWIAAGITLLLVLVLIFAALVEIGEQRKARAAARQGLNAPIITSSGTTSH